MSDQPHQTDDNQRSPARRHLIVSGVLLLFLLPGAMSLTAGWLGERRAGTLVGTVAPPLNLTVLGDTAIPPADVTVINFWATWCGPCRAEMPLLDAAHAADNGVRVLAVNQGEGRGAVATFVDELGLSLPVLLDSDRRAAHDYGVMGLPTTVFVNGDGVVYAVHAGVLTATTLADYIAAADTAQG